MSKSEVMKKTISAIIALAFVFLFTSSFATTDKESKASVKKSELKGPNAKNYHPAKYDLQTSEVKTVSLDHPAKNLKGPKAKNYSPEGYEYTSRHLNNIETAKKEKRTGPNAKNRRFGH